MLLVAALWTPIAVPALVKFPTSTNVHLVYTGSFVTYLNPKTGATLTSPEVAGLTIDRHLQALPAESTSSVALVRETMAVRAGATSMTEINVYALDRRTMQAVSGPESIHVQAWKYPRSRVQLLRDPADGTQPNFRTPDLEARGRNDISDPSRCDLVRADTQRRWTGSRSCGSGAPWR